jgi:hypothetical protein
MRCRELGILFVGRWGNLGVRARHEGSPEISGGRCAAGRGRRKKGRQMGPAEGMTEN